MRFDANPTAGMAFCCALVAAVATSPDDALAGTPIEKRTAADPQGTVEVSNVAGSIKVSGWSRNEVEVTGELGDGTERLEFTKGDGITRVKVVLPGKSYNVDETHLVVKVPAASALAINAVSADVVVQGVQGAQRLQSVSGDVRTVAGGDDLECRTVSGDVTIEGSGRKGLVSVTTVSGDANARRVAGEVNGSTVSGTFNLQAGDVMRSRLRSTSGDVILNARLMPDARLDLESISGDLLIDFVGTIPGQFDVSSFNGEIRNCFGPKPVSTSDYAPGRELRFQEEGATARVRAKTLNGDISICRE